MYEDRSGYVFLFLLISGHIVGYLFWYYCCRSYYGGTNPIEETAAKPQTDSVTAQSATASD